MHIPKEQLIELARTLDNLSDEAFIWQEKVRKISDIGNEKHLPISVFHLEYKITLGWVRRGFNGDFLCCDHSGN